MSLFWMIFPVVTFIVVLSWTDLQSHVGYAFNVSLEEGLWKFPLIWFQSFCIPICFLRSGKSKFDYEMLSSMERACRLALSDEVTISYDQRRNSYTINGKQNITFKMDNSDSVEINGWDKLIPPRVAFLMLACRSKAHKQLKESLKTDKPKSLFG